MTSSKGKALEGITSGIRSAATFDPSTDTVVFCGMVAFDDLCDAVDAVHHELEEENGRLFGEVRRLTKALASSTQLPVASDGEPVDVGDLVAANGTPREAYRVVGVGGELVFLNSGAHIAASACHHVSTRSPEGLREWADMFERTARGRGFVNREAFYNALHELVEAACRLAEGGE